MNSDATIRTVTRWGDWLHGLVKCSDSDLAQRDVAEINLRCAEGLPGTDDSLLAECHGILTGFGGTCVSMPVLYCAIGRRLGYPLTLAEASEHYFCRWDDEREHFCFDATSRGTAIRDVDYYRQWPKPITPAEERTNGFIRPMTRREELAAFAVARGNCLIDNYQFVAACEAFQIASKIAPDKDCHYYAWGLATYSPKLWGKLSSLPDHLKRVPINHCIGPAAKELDGPDADFFRQRAVDNVLRIARNRERRHRIALHQAAFQELQPQ